MVPNSPRSSRTNSGDSLDLRADRWRRSVRIGLVAATGGTSLLLGVALSAPASGQGVSAQPATAVAKLTPAADTFVSYAAPKRTFGSAERLTAGRAGDARKVAYLKFSLTAAQLQSLESAKLVLTRDLHHLSGTVSVHTAATAWQESTMTAATAATVGRVLASQPVSRDTTSVSLNVTSGVTGRTVGFAVTSSLTSDVARFLSSEAGAGGPYLRLTLRAQQPAGSSAPPSSSSAPVPTNSSSAPPAPVTTSPPPAPVTTSPAPTSGCTFTAKLVPSCGRWWGMAPRQLMNVALSQGLQQDEAAAGRSFDIVHNYHTNGSLFPTTEERAIALQPGHNRILFENWKPSTSMSWAQVAAGAVDDRIDTEAAYLNSTFQHPFFLTIWHEPENDVNATPGSGRTAADYAAMFRHVVERLRADGVTQAITVMNYMGYVPWAQHSWFPQLWPGNDVVDWIGIDPYGSGDATGYLSGDLATLINRKGTSFPGFYTWATTQHPDKPLMVVEWGVGESTTNPTGKAAYFRSVASEIDSFPAVRGMMYYDSDNCPDPGYRDTRPDSTATSLAAFKTLSADPRFSVGAFHYSGTGVVSGP